MDACNPDANCNHPLGCTCGGVLTTGEAMPGIFGGVMHDLTELWKSQPIYEYEMFPSAHAQGWECPKCGRVYSPSMVMCSYCGPKATVTTGTGNVTRPDYDTFTTETNCES